MKNIALITSKRDIQTIKNDNFSITCLLPEETKDIPLNTDIILADTQNDISVKHLKNIYPAKIWALTKDTSKENILHLYNQGFDNVVQYPDDITNLCKTIINPDNEEFFPKHQTLKKILVLCKSQTEIDFFSRLIKKIKTLYSICTACKNAETETQNTDFDLIISTEKNTLNKLRQKNPHIKFLYFRPPFDSDEILLKIKNFSQYKNENDSFDEQSETFIAALTHDLKSPITAEQNIIKQILEGKFGELNSTQAELLSEILNSRDYMKRMIDNLLLRYRATSNNFEISPKVNNYKDIIETSVKELSHITNAKKQKIILKYNADTENFNFDKTEIKRVLVNLISNAAEYTASNGTIKITVEETPTDIITNVSDNGYGIAEKDLPYIFEKNITFAKKYRKVGSGLGLYISKAIIDAHSGTISVKSKINKGSTFTFTLPKI